MKNLEEIWERYYPVVIAVIFVAIIIFINPELCIWDDINAILSATISFASIVICFLGALVALIFSTENKIMNTVIESEYYSIRIRKFFLRPIQFGFTWVFLSIIFFFRVTFYNIYTLNKIDIKNTMIISKAIWLYLFIYFLLSSYRIISIILKISFIGNKVTNSDNKETEDELVTEEEYETVKNKNSI